MFKFFSYEAVERAEACEETHAETETLSAEGVILDRTAHRLRVSTRTRHVFCRLAVDPSSPEPERQSNLPVLSTDSSDQ